MTIDRLIQAAVVAMRAQRDPSDEACCVYAQRVDEALYNLPPATGQILADARLYDIAAPWSTVKATFDRGIAEWARYPPTTPTPVVGRLHAIQGWRGTPGAPVSPGTRSAGSRWTTRGVCNSTTWSPTAPTCGSARGRRW